MYNTIKATIVKFLHLHNLHHCCSNHTNILQQIPWHFSSGYKNKGFWTKNRHGRIEANNWSISNFLNFSLNKHKGCYNMSNLQHNRTRMKVNKKQRSCKKNSLSNTHQWCHNHRPHLHTLHLLALQIHLFGIKFWFWRDYRLTHSLEIVFHPWKKSILAVLRRWTVC